MRTTHPISVTLPGELLELVKGKVRSGEYASDSEVVRDGLRLLAARDRVVESWLREEVVRAAEALAADASRGRSIDEVRAHLSRKRSFRKGEQAGGIQQARTASKR